MQTYEISQLQPKLSVERDNNYEVETNTRTNKQ
jgi:hypothetical protein